jgi:hypothetical protein
LSTELRNAHVQILKEVFATAVRDRIISHSPAAHLKYTKHQKPSRLTPTWEQFKAIVGNVRGQVFNADSQDSADFLEIEAAKSRNATRGLVFMRKESTGGRLARAN